MRNPTQTASHRPFCVRLAAALLACAAAAARGETLARYLDVNSSGMNVEVRINGFPIYESADWHGGSGSVFLGSVLHKGKNEIAWTARAGPVVLKEGQPGWVEVEVMEAPADTPLRTGENPGKALYAKRVLPLATAELLPGAAEGREILTGSVSEENGAAVFRQIAPRRWAWGMRLTGPDLRIAGRPVTLRHALISDSLVRGEIHFLQSGTDRHVVFTDLRLPRGGGKIEFADEMAARGARFLDGGEFDTVWIFGTAAEGVDQLTLAMLSVDTARRSYEERAEFEVALDHEWAWQQAGEIGDLAGLPEERAALIAHLRRLHEAMNGTEIETWTPFFETKVAELAKATGQDAAALGGQQLEFFRDLAAIEGWRLEPFDEDRLLLQQVNSRVVRVRYVDSDGPILSVPLPKPGEPETLDRFTIPLYLAKVGGQWTVVK